MRVEAPPIAVAGVSFTESRPGWWTVTIDGDASRTITRDETGFIAWIGTRDRHWCFDRALKSCIDDARYQRSLRDEAAQASAAAKARIEVLSDGSAIGDDCGSRGGDAWGFAMLKAMSIALGGRPS